MTGLLLYNALGKEMQEQEFEAKESFNRVQFAAGSLAKGIFFLKLQGENVFGSCKVVVQ